MIKSNTTAYFIFGNNGIRYGDEGSTRGYVVLEVNTSSQQIGFNSALILCKPVKTHYYEFSSNFEIVRDEEGLLSDYTDEFGLTDKILGQFNNASEHIAPLFLAVIQDKTLYTYSLLLSNLGEHQFVNNGKEKVEEEVLKIASFKNYFETALKNHRNHSYKLNNYIGLYTKTEPDNEYEYKLDLPPTVDIWYVHKYFIQALRNGKIPGYTFNPLKGITRWAFENYLFEITSPEEEKGYVSFIRNPNNTYIIKHKIYKYDQLKRIELRSRDVTIEGTLEEYLHKTYPSFTFKRYPMFVRHFYGFVMESLDTGNNFGFTVDRNIVEGYDCPPLVQVEIEYYNSLSLSKPEAFNEELIKVTDFHREHLTKLNISFTNSFYSKLTYLKDCVEGKLTNGKN